ncbi:sodium channel protein Nach-like [Plodia interpunctella]|uniref:sodium channel protein Nach-like n=1 Tax=Plodia interpunctella TaxID=58824 RepID=UPI0023679B35|nr:sodium channel protein Nach-like [Plodia interpunctella]
MNAKKLLKEAQFHGLNKLDDSKCRWIWTLSLFLLLLASSAIVASIVSRFLNQPTYITRLERIYTKMEFPSVQVCPEISYPDHKIDEFLSQLDYPPHLNMSYVKTIIQQLGAFYSPDVPYTVRELERIESVLNLNDIDVYLAAKKLTGSCKETLLRCRLFGVMRTCSKLFSLEISQYGFCCVFNGRSLRSEMRKHGVRKKVPKSVYYTTSVGFRSGLILAINQSTPLLDVDLTYKWVSIDGGHAYIDSTVNGTPLSSGTEMWQSHRVDGMHIDEGAASLNTELRGCRLLEEPLTYFPIYHKYQFEV